MTHELHYCIFQALHANQIEIPFPRQDAHFRHVPANLRTVHLSALALPLPPSEEGIEAPALTCDLDIDSVHHPFG